jgi:hypothetical protein
MAIAPAPVSFPGLPPCTPYLPSVPRYLVIRCPLHPSVTSVPELIHRPSTPAVDQRSNVTRDAQIPAICSFLTLCCSPCAVLPSHPAKPVILHPVPRCALVRSVSSFCLVESCPTESPYLAIFTPKTSPPRPVRSNGPLPRNLARLRSRDNKTLNPPPP